MVTMVAVVAMVEMVTSTGWLDPAVLERETDDAADGQTPWKGMTYWEFVSRMSEHFINFSENICPHLGMCQTSGTMLFGDNHGESSFDLSIDF